MRLLLITERYAPEARSNAHIFQDLAEGLARRGHDVTVLAKMPSDYLPNVGCEKQNPPPSRNIENGVRVLRVGELFGPRRSIFLRVLDQVFFGICVIWRASLLEKPERMIVYSPPLPLACLAGVYARARRIPLVLNLHDIYPRTPVELGVLRNPILIWAARVMEEITYRCAAFFLVPSPGSRDYLINEKNIPAAKVRLIFNWVNVDAVAAAGKDNGFRKSQNLNGEFVVSYAGVMGYAQDLGAIISCAAKMAHDPGVVFYLVGDGVYRQRWEREAAGLKNVRFLPNLDREGYLDLLRASDVCLAPLTAALKSPAIPGKFQNIMAAARPVIAIVPEDSEAARVIHESGAGVVVAPGDENGLMEALSLLRGDKALLETKGRQGRRFAEENFNLGRALSRIDDILNGEKRDIQR
ncbi:MAG: glycosyltransferase family 4 protein [Elusimicrobiota bacterium]